MKIKIPAITWESAAKHPERIYAGAVVADTANDETALVIAQIGKMLVCVSDGLTEEYVLSIDDARVPIGMDTLAEPEPAIDLTPAGDAIVNHESTTAAERLFASADRNAVEDLAREAIILRTGLHEILGMEPDEQASAFRLIELARMVDTDHDEYSAMVDRLREALDQIETVHAAATGQPPVGSPEKIVARVRETYAKVAAETKGAV